MTKPYVRLNVEYGWGGVQFQLTLEESAATNDHLIEVDGIAILIAEKDQEKFHNKKVDFVTGLFGLGGEFRVVNRWK